MQIVIDIPEFAYNEILEMAKNGRVFNLLEAVSEGVPLPKGHGKLGDLDALREEVSSWDMNDYEPSDFIDAIDQADIIIEADKEE